MASVTLNPTANQTPDAGQAGVAVTGAINTGHGSTVTASSGATDSDFKTCRWFTFQTLGAGLTVASLSLKASWTVTSGILNGDGAGNFFGMDYTLNGGSVWNVFDNISNTTSASGTPSINLAQSQNISQVQVRCIWQTGTTDIGELASITGSVSNIRIEAVLSDANRMILMGI